MKATRFYIGSILVNFIPIIVMRLIMGNTVGDQNIGYYIFGIFFTISVVLNISFFFTTTKYVQKSKFKRFLSYYLSSVFLFILGTLLVSYDIITSITNTYSSNNLFRDFLMSLLIYYSYFIVNLLFALYLKKQINMG